MAMSEAEILAYQREQFEAKGMSQEEVDRVFGTGEWEYERRVEREAAGDPYPYVPQAETQAFYEAIEAGRPAEHEKYEITPAPAPVVIPAPVPVVLKGGELMSYTQNGQVMPGDPPTSLTIAGPSPEAGGAPVEMSLAWLILAISKFLPLTVGLIKGFITKFGLTTILSIVGTAIIAKVMASLNDNETITGSGPEGVGVTIVKRWRANETDFWMDSAGYMYARRKDGVIKRWKPAKPIVMVRGKVTLAQAVKAQRYLDYLWRTVAKRTKQLKLA